LLEAPRILRHAFARIDIFRAKSLGETRKVTDKSPWSHHRNTGAPFVNRGEQPVVVLAWWALFFTRWGLSLRAVGENPTAAFAAGKNPHALQYQALFIAGLLGGIAGAHLSLGPAKTWAEWMTAGRGFIAVALVIFSKWQPLRTIAGALLFGGAISLQLQLQVLGVPVSPFLLDMLPYLLSLAVLAVWSGARRSAAPGSLGRVFQRTD
jgi:simple sugar transport system permease protein